VGAQLYRTDGQRAMTKLTAAIRKRYVNAPKNRRLAPTPNLYVKPREHKQFKISICVREGERCHSWLRVKLWALAFTVWHCGLIGAGRRFGQTYCCCVQGRRHKCMPAWKPKMLYLITTALFADASQTEHRMGRICPSVPSSVRRLHVWNS